MDRKKQKKLEKKYGPRLVALAECFGEALAEADPDHLNFLFAAITFIASYAGVKAKGETANMEPLDYRNYLYN